MVLKIDVIGIENQFFRNWYWELINFGIDSSLYYTYSFISQYNVLLIRIKCDFFILFTWPFLYNVVIYTYVSPIFVSKYLGYYYFPKMCSGYKWWFLMSSSLSQGIRGLVYLWNWVLIWRIEVKRAAQRYTLVTNSAMLIEAVGALVLSKIKC